MQSLEKEFQEKLSDRMKTGLVLSMCPRDLQDMMYQQAANLKDYPDVKARLKGIIQNRIARGQPSPMDIGKVGGEEADQDEGIYYTTTGKRKVKRGPYVPQLWPTRALCSGLPERQGQGQRQLPGHVLLVWRIWPHSEGLPKLAR